MSSSDMPILLKVFQYNMSTELPWSIIVFMMTKLVTSIVTTMGSSCLGFMFLKSAFVKSIGGRSLLLLLLMEYTKLTARKCLFREDEVVPPLRNPRILCLLLPYGHGSSEVPSFSAFSSSSFVPCGFSTYFLLLSSICSGFSIFMTCSDETSQMTLLYEFFDLIFQSPTIFCSVPKIVMVPAMFGMIHTLQGGGSARCSKMIGIECFFHGF